MLTHTAMFSEERTRANFTITPEIFDFLESNLQFQKMPKGFLVAKMRKPYVQITVHFPEHFEVGNETSLVYWTHTNPFNTVEHRFSFSPPHEEKPENASTDELFALVFKQLSISNSCDWRGKIENAFSLESSY